jgi:hypothetical protein
MSNQGVGRARAVFKFTFWTGVSAALVAYAFHSYYSGQMVRWYYHTAKFDGYAVNAKAFMDATEENPAILEVGRFDAIEGLHAVRVRKGDRLPANATGIISLDEIRSGKRAFIEGDRIKVVKPWVIQETKGIRYKDTFTHKGIKTNPWSGVWNVLVVLSLGLALGLMAEGFTDILGMKIDKTMHRVGH